MAKSSRKRIAIGVGVVAIVAIGVVASQWEQILESWKCEQLIIGIWEKTPGGVGTYIEFFDGGGYSLALAPRFGPAQPALLERGRFAASGCSLAFRPTYSAFGRAEAWNAELQSLGESEFAVSTPDGDYTLSRLTDPPVRLEELLASEPAVEEVER